jgi:4,5:9,10-diseco-3-hydroxy-5,9,17-trioxoandrosta-1(10),2-diene-4-oate hydrolase
VGDLRNAAYRVSSGYDIHIAEAGEGPAVVFLHGSGPGASGASNFRGNWPAFVAAGYRVILPDLIGYGASSKPEGIDYTLQLFTDTLHEALLAHGVETAILVGNSLGGGIAVQLVLDHPGFALALVLMAPGCIEERETYFAMPGIANMVSSFGGPDFDIVEQRRLIGNLVHPDFASQIPDALVAERFAVARTQPKDVLVRMRTPNLAPRLCEITQPILGFWGIDDAFCPASGAAHFLGACRDVRFMTFGRTGHWVQVERAAEFNRTAIAFLDDHR